MSGRKRILPEAGSRLWEYLLAGYQVRNSPLRLAFGGEASAEDVKSVSQVGFPQWRPPERAVHSSTRGV